VTIGVAAVLMTLLLLGIDHGIVKRPSFLYQTLFLVVFGTVLIYRYLYKLSSPAQFIQLYLFLMVIKLMAFLGYNLFMIIQDRPAAGANVIFFLVAYFIFTFLEIVFLYRQIDTGAKG
jgi:hypothetical protein